MVKQHKLGMLVHMFSVTKSIHLVFRVNFFLESNNIQVNPWFKIHSRFYALFVSNQTMAGTKVATPKTQSPTPLALSYHL